MNLTKLWKTYKKKVQIALVIILGVFSIVTLNEYIQGTTLSRIGGNNFSSSTSIFGLSESDTYGEASLSYRNVSGSPVIEPSAPAGDDLEEFEYTSHYLSYEKNNAAETCEQIFQLKERDDVIFSASNEYDKGCSYTFKVKNSLENEILSILDSLDPKDSSTTTETIKSQIDDFTSEEEILRASLTRIEETLNDALSSYDEISLLATEVQDVETLAKIIDSKISLIERLTQEKIRLNEQLDRLARAKSEQLDRLDFTTFSVRVFERKYIDGERIKESWRLAVEKSVQTTNTILQGVSVNLFVLVLFILQYALYGVLLLIAAKVFWKLVQKIWNK